MHPGFYLEPAQMPSYSQGTGIIIPDLNPVKMQEQQSVNQMDTLTIQSFGAQTGQGSTASA